jgi:peptidylamidoglycolate lyase
MKPLSTPHLNQAHCIMKIKLALLFTILMVSFTGIKKPKKTDQSRYELVKNWPVLQKDVQLGQPTGIGIDKDEHIFVFHRAGRLWTTPFPDSLISRNTVFELDNETGKVIHAWGADYFIMPHGLTVDKQNNIWLTDVGLHQIFKFSHDGKLLMKLGVAKVPGKDSLHFNLPTDIAVEDDGTFYVSDGYGNSRVIKFSASGKYLKEWGSYGNKPGQFIIPHGIAIDKNYTLYVADRQNNRVQAFDTSGKFLMELKNDVQVQQVPSIAIDQTDHLFAIDYDPRLKKDSTVNGSTIFEFDAQHQAVHHFGATGSTERTSCWFHDMAIDNKGNIYVGDIIGFKVLKFKPRKSL